MKQRQVNEGSGSSRCQVPSMEQRSLNSNRAKYLCCVTVTFIQEAFHKRNHDLCHMKKRMLPVKSDQTSFKDKNQKYNNKI